MGISDLMGAPTSNTSMWSGISGWLANPANQARLFSAGRAFDTMARAPYTTASGQALPPGPGTIIAEQGLKDLQPTLQNKATSSIIKSQPPPNPLTPHPQVSALMGSAIGHMSSPDVGEIQMQQDANGNLVGVRMKSPSPVDTANAATIEAQRQAGVVSYPSTPQTSDKISPYVGGGQSPF